jgi:hypothetical protein
VNGTSQEQASSEEEGTMQVDEIIRRMTQERREQMAAFLADRSNRLVIELGARVRDDLLCENGSASVEWRAGIVAARAWNAAARAGRTQDLT